MRYITTQISLQRDREHVVESDESTPGIAQISSPGLIYGRFTAMRIQLGAITSELVSGCDDLLHRGDDQTNARHRDSEPERHPEGCPVRYARERQTDERGDN